MKNPKHIIGLMVFGIGVVWFTIRNGGEITKDLSNSRLNFDDSTALHLKSNSFKLTRQKTEKVAPTWGSFKSQPLTVNSSSPAPSTDNNQVLLAKLAKKASDKLKEREKRKKKLAQKKRSRKSRIANLSPDPNQLRNNGFPRGTPPGDESPVTPASFNLPVAKSKSEATKTPLEEDEFRTLEEWEELLVKHENPEATQELIKEFKAGTLGKKEWAHMLASKMITNSDPAVQLQGLTVLNALPSTESFSVLVKNPPLEELHSPSFAQERDRSMKAYARNLKYLPILEQSVLSKDTVVQIEAARYMVYSAQIQLGETQRNNRMDGKIQPSPKSQFSNSILALTTASYSTENPETKAFLEKSIDDIKRFLG